MSNAQRVDEIGEFTYRDYQQWPARPRYELLDGHARLMAPPTTVHQRVVFELGGQIRNALQGHACQAFAGPVGVRLPASDEADDFIKTVLEPDLVIVCDANKIDAKGIRGAPDVVIEVLSPSTAAYDSIDKRYAYERAGVRELWLIDVASGLVHRFRREASGFSGPEIVRAEGQIELCLGFSLSLDFMVPMRQND